MVVLDRDMRDDDVEVVKNAIKMVKFVSSVENGLVVDLHDHTARDDLRIGLITDLYGLLRAASLNLDDWKEIKQILDRTKT